jgi:hypothetical protein
MPVINFNRFELGIDLRKGRSVSDANRLLEMKNAHVTTGLATEKRPGLSHVTTLAAGTKGLFAGLGKLNTFYGEGTITHSDALFDAHKCLLDDAEAEVTDVQFAEVFNGYIYAAITFGNTTKHHYLDGSEVTQIQDANCPHTTACLKAASKMFAVGTDGSVVRFTKTGDPKDWTTTEDAGFLPTGLNARGDRATKALGMYQNNLVALARDGAQVWVVDPDPTAMKLTELVDNVGTSFHRSLATVSGDLYFLSDYGFRSITTLQLLSKLSDVDIGSPIDEIVRPAVRAIEGSPKAIYFYGTGKYMCAVDNQVFVYSVSRTAKIAAWSRYVLPFPVDAWAELEGVLYMRAGDEVYSLSEDAFTDDGELYAVEIQLPYMDFKTPGMLKRIYAIDLVVEGECDFQIAFDANHPEYITDAVRIVGNTRGGGLIPIECCGTEFSFKFLNETDEDFRLDAISVHYEVLGPQF